MPRGKPVRRALLKVEGRELSKGCWSAGRGPREMGWQTRAQWEVALPIKHFIPLCTGALLP
eukprot:scaffold26622_cov22-Tisochrysis_lutea.AAC.4